MAAGSERVQATGPWEGAGAARRLTGLALCLAVAVLEGFDIQALGVAAPAFRTSLGLAPASLGWLFLASNLGVAVGAVGGGRLSDRVGRKPVFVGAVLLFGVFTLATAAVRDLGAFAAVRVLAGVGLGAGLTNMVAIAADLSDPRRRVLVTAALLCGAPLGGALVAAVAQELTLATAWRGLFVAGGIVPLGLAGVIAAALPESRRAPRVAAPLALRRVLFAEGRTAPTLLLWLAFVPTAAALYLMLYWLPVLVVSDGLAPVVAARSTLAFNLAGVAGALALGRLVDRLPTRVALALAYGVLLAAGLLLSVARGAGAVVALSGAAGAALLGVTYALYGLATRFYPAEGAATGAGAAIGMGRVGAILGPLAPGYLDPAAPRQVFWLVAALALLAAGAVTMLRPPARTAPATPAAAP